MSKYQPSKKGARSYVDGKVVYEGEEESAQADPGYATPPDSDDELSENSESEAPAPKPGFWAQTAEKKRGKEFDLADVLQVVSGKFLGTEGYDSVFDLLSYMTGIRIDSITYPDALAPCATEILRQYPKMKRCAPGGDRFEFDHEDTDLWLSYRRKEFGDQIVVDRLPDDEASELHETVEMKLRAMNPKKRKPKMTSVID